MKILSVEQIKTIKDRILTKMGGVDGIREHYRKYEAEMNSKQANLDSLHRNLIKRLHEMSPEELRERHERLTRQLPIR